MVPPLPVHSNSENKLLVMANLVITATKGLNQ